MEKHMEKEPSYFQMDLTISVPLSTTTLREREASTIQANWITRENSKEVVSMERAHNQDKNTDS